MKKTNFLNYMLETLADNVNDNNRFVYDVLSEIADNYNSKHQRCHSRYDYVAKLANVIKSLMNDNHIEIKLHLYCDYVIQRASLYKLFKNTNDPIIILAIDTYQTMLDKKPMYFSLV